MIAKFKADLWNDIRKVIVPTLIEEVGYIPIPRIEYTDESVFRLQDVNVKIGTLKFAIRDSKHDFLYKTLRPLATALIKKQIQKAIRDTMRTGLEYIDGRGQGSESY